MGESKLAALFLTILAAGTAMLVTMVALLVQFLGGIGQAEVWRAIIVALAGAGMGLSVVGIVHLSLIASRRTASARRDAHIANWTHVWSAVAAGADGPSVRTEAMEAAAEGAALVLQDTKGEGAERIRLALLASGTITADLALATRGLLSQAGDSTAALERLAWIAVPETLPLFEVAAGSSSDRVSRAALLGLMRVLAGQRNPEDIGVAVIEAVEEHVRTTRDAEGARPFLTAVMLAADDNLAWLCRELLASGATTTVRVAALDAMGRSQRPEAGEIATVALLGGAQGETKAAALRTLASVGYVPPVAVKAVVTAASDAVKAVRVQAAYALVGVESSVALPALWDGLADEAWEVRRACADALLSYGRAGAELLRRAALEHSDRFARDVSNMALGTQGSTVVASKPAVAAVRDGPIPLAELPLIGDFAARGLA